ncbi:ISAzo13 family transposase [Singulisphaera sp. GP187]|uniref:ISAzo13 family transposase n=1 Tax=Singulisphaera sp. GP187 TaxID=1882752 RepID=UPI0009418D7B|nr:ISAzo13 family transposase [Singulisphaera sp. GP187]
MIDVESAIKARFDLLSPLLNERTRRLISAAEAGVLGRGGITIVSRLTGVSRRAIAAGLAELRSRDNSARGRVRRPGGGRRRRIVDDDTLVRDLEQLINPVSKGDLTSPLRWTCSSVRTLAAELVRIGHATSHRMVAELLHSSGYSLQSKRRRVEGGGPSHRDIQFGYINHKVSEALRTGQPVITVESMTKEIVDQPKSKGKSVTPDEIHRPDRLENVNVGETGRCEFHLDDEHAGAHGKGRSGVMVDRDMTEFTVEVIHRWWQSMGSKLFLKAQSLLVVADIGGGDDLTAHLWRSGLQKLANETQLAISVFHFPPATTRWSHIEHRLVATISPYLRDKPAVSHDVVISLVTAAPAVSEPGATRSLVQEGSTRGTELTYQEIENLLLTAEGLHGGWNYTIVPNTAAQ